MPDGQNPSSVLWLKTTPFVEQKVQKTDDRQCTKDHPKGTLKRDRILPTTHWRSGDGVTPAVPIHELPGGFVRKEDTSRGSGRPRNSAFTARSARRGAGDASSYPAKVVSRQRRLNKVYDQTLGYDGEGPTIPELTRRYDDALALRIEGEAIRTDALAALDRAPNDAACETTIAAEAAFRAADADSAAANALFESAQSDLQQALAIGIDVARSARLRLDDSPLPPVAESEHDDHAPLDTPPPLMEGKYDSVDFAVCIEVPQLPVSKDSLDVSPVVVSATQPSPATAAVMPKQQKTAKKAKTALPRTIVLDPSAAAYRQGRADALDDAASGHMPLNVKGMSQAQVAAAAKQRRIVRKKSAVISLILPGKETVSCRNCKSLGHHAGECPNPETPACKLYRLKQESRDLAAIAKIEVSRRSAEVVIDMDGDDHNAPDDDPSIAPPSGGNGKSHPHRRASVAQDGGDPPPLPTPSSSPPGGKIPLTPAQKAAQKKADDDELAAKVEADCYEKASTAWLTKDPKSPVDIKVVIQSLVQIVRKEGYYRTRPGASHRLVMAVHERALRDGIAARAATANSITYSTAPGVPLPQSSVRGYSGWVFPVSSRIAAFRRYLVLDDLFYLKGSILEEMQKDERIMPLSRDRNVYPIIMLFATICRCFLVPLAEELLKRFNYGVALPAWNESFLPNFFSLPDVLFTARIEAILEDNGFMGWWQLIPCLFLAYRETKLHGLPGRIESAIELSARFFAHAWLAHMSLLEGFFVHVIWNAIAIFCYVFLGATLFWRLDSFVFSTSVKSTVYEDVCLSGHWLKPIKLDPRFVYSPGEATCRGKFGCRQAWGISGIIPTVYRKCICNETISIEGRVGKLVPAAAVEPAVDAHWRQAIKRVAVAFRHVSPLTHAMKFTSWCASFPPSKRDRFLDMKLNGFDAPVGQASAFIKTEIAMKDGEQPFPTMKDPRFIQGCEESLSVICGPWIRPLTKKFKKGMSPRRFSPSEIRDGRQIIYMCGDNAHTVGENFRKGIDLLSSMMDFDDQIIFIEDDQSRFDLHIRKGAFDAVHSLYQGRIPERIRRFLLRKTSRGKTGHGSKYSIPYTMQSGWPDTSLTDTVVNAIMKYSIHGVGGLWLSIIMGDDSVTITTRKSLASLGGESAILKQYEAFGMEIELSVKHFALDVEMCSSRFFPCGESYILMPKPGKIIARSLTDMVDRSPAGQKEWLKGIATGHEYAGRVDHVIGSMARGIRKTVGQGEGLIVRDDYKIQILKNVPTTTWLDVCIYYDHHYGFSEDQVLQVMHELENLEFGTTSSHSLLVVLARTDAL